MNPSTAFAVTFVDELVRCGLTDLVLAPGSRSAPLAIAAFDRARHGDLRLHVRIDERSAAFLALGLAKTARRPVAVLCTSGTAAANLHPAIIEADESSVPLLALTADRPPELRGTGANQAIDQIKLYDGAVRWFCEAGVPEKRAGMVTYWRSLACAAWARAAGKAGGTPGPVHVNLPLREPLVPDPPPSGNGQDDATDDWPEPLTGRPDGAPWTRFAAGAAPPASPAGTGSTAHRDGPAATTTPLEVPWTERGVIICGDGDYDPEPLLHLAEQAGWPILAEPQSGCRRGRNALSAYPYLLATPDFVAAHRPEVIITAGRPGLSRPQLAFLARTTTSPQRHIVLAAPTPDRTISHWADPTRTATDVAAAVQLAANHPRRRDDAADTEWLASWRRADTAARRAADQILQDDDALTEPRLARDLPATLPDGALLWIASSLPIRDLDHHMTPRPGLRVLANRGASGIDGLVSTAIGAALAHQAAGGGPAVAVLGDLAFLHDLTGLAAGPSEKHPNLCLIVVNNDGGGIFGLLEHAALAGPGGPFETVFATPHGTDIRHIAAAFALPYTLLERPDQLPEALHGAGLRIAELRTDRSAGVTLRHRLTAAATRAATATIAASPLPSSA